MSIQEVSAEQLAELFHHYQQSFESGGGASRPTAEEWEQLSQPEKDRLIAAARLTLVDLISTAKELEDSRRYFAKPGEAEWGC
jgi:hypothetical protein